MYNQEMFHIKYVGKGISKTLPKILTITCAVRINSFVLSMSQVLLCDHQMAHIKTYYHLCVLSTLTLNLEYQLSGNLKVESFAVQFLGFSTYLALKSLYGRTIYTLKCLRKITIYPSRISMKKSVRENVTHALPNP